jgi:hypothetical protein
MTNPRLELKVNILLRCAHRLTLMVLAALLTSCSYLRERSDFTPNQTGVAACQFTAGAHPQVVAHERTPYGESVRTRTGQTQMMKDCYEHLDAIADAAADKASANESE